MLDEYGRHPLDQLIALGINPAHASNKNKIAGPRAQRPGSRRFNGAIWGEYFKESDILPPAHLSAHLYPIGGNSITKSML